MEHCLDRRWFWQYPYSIDYCYNSRGFRDTEWPGSIQELKSCIWCLGDSFTLGIGQPWSHTWPQRLQHKTKKRIINVSLDGASNDWLCRTARQIYDVVQPDMMIIMWSFDSRREHQDQSLSDEQRRSKGQCIDPANNAIHFRNLLEWLSDQTQQTNMLWYLIPGAAGSSKTQIRDFWLSLAGNDWPSAPYALRDLQALPDSLLRTMRAVDGSYELIESLLKALEIWTDLVDQYDLIQVPSLDIARDGYHFDIKTSDWVVNDILSRWVTVPRLVAD